MTWIPLFPADSLPVGSARALWVQELACEVGVFHREEGWFAMENTCPHHDAALSEGRVANGVVACPMHAWKFRLRDGFCFTGPQFQLSTWALEIRQGILGLLAHEPNTQPFLSTGT